jgi:hypothetical protein
MRLAQLRDAAGKRRVAATTDDKSHRLVDAETVYELALDAIDSARSLVDVVKERLTQDGVDLDAAEAEGRLLPPLDHPVPTRCWVSGTGLTHMGGAAARDAMHKKIAAADSELSDSMKMFKWGVEGGKPADGGAGSQPEWFFKGNGAILVAGGQPLESPPFAWDGGEEPELVGLYVIAEDGTPCRVGFCLGNEFTDHVMERKNYLYLAHSKLRQASIGPELVLGGPPMDVQGTSRIVRGGKVVWEKPFVTGEQNITHRISGLEHHHFKYSMFRRPGDVHVHFFGTSTLSCLDGFVTEEGDVFEVSAPGFGRPLRNRLVRAAWSAPAVRAL